MDMLLVAGEASVSVEIETDEEAGLRRDHSTLLVSGAMRGCGRAGSDSISRAAALIVVEGAKADKTGEGINSGALK